MYDPDYLNPMDKKSPIQPPSKKGTVRANIAAQILDRIQSGRIKGLIARSADFYGPSIANTSILTETVIQPLVAGKTAKVPSRTQMDGKNDGLVPTYHERDPRNALSV